MNVRKVERDRITSLCAQQRAQLERQFRALRRSSGVGAKLGTLARFIWRHSAWVAVGGVTALTLARRRWPALMAGSWFALKLLRRFARR